MVKHSLLILLLFASTALGMEVVLQWDANKEADLAGYRVYVRDRSTASSFALYSTLGKQTECTLGNLSSAHKYELRVTAFNNYSAESSYSNPVHVNVPVKQLKVKRLNATIR